MRGRAVRGVPQAGRQRSASLILSSPKDAATQSEVASGVKYFTSRFVTRAYKIWKNIVTILGAKWELQNWLAGMACDRLTCGITQANQFVPAGRIRRVLRGVRRARIDRRGQRD